MGREGCRSKKSYSIGKETKCDGLFELLRIPLKPDSVNYINFNVMGVDKKNLFSSTFIIEGVWKKMGDCHIIAISEPRTLTFIENITLNVAIKTCDKYLTVIVNSTLPRKIMWSVSAKLSCIYMAKGTSW